jgi:hypothetical protein
MCDRLPAGSVQPTTTNSSRFKHLDLTQIPRSPGAYGRSARSRWLLPVLVYRLALGSEDRHRRSARCTAAQGFLFKLACSRFLRSIRGSRAVLCPFQAKKIKGEEDKLIGAAFIPCRL